MSAKQQKEGQGRRRLLPAATAEEKAAKKRFEALHHPWRIRILEMLYERDLSAAQIVDEGIIPDVLERPREKAISDVAYHFRVLRQAGIIEVVDEQPRRGGTERVCRIRVSAYHSDEEWAALSLEQRRLITEATLDGLIARARSALLFDTFDARIDRHMATVPMEIDEQGWAELLAHMKQSLDVVLKIKEESERRLADSGERPMRATFGHLGFESAPLPGSSE